MTTAAAAAKSNNLTLATVQKHGFIAGYAADFATNVTKGVAFVASGPVAFKTSAGAVWGYTSDVNHALNESGAHRLGAVAVGDAGVALGLTQKSDKILVTVYDIAFHRKTWSVDGIGGAANTFKLADAIHYAKIVDARIQHGG